MGSDKLLCFSDYFSFMYDCAETLIKKGLGVCVRPFGGTKSGNIGGTLTEPGKESPYRNRTVEENLQLFHARCGMALLPTDEKVLAGERSTWLPPT